MGNWSINIQGSGPHHNGPAEPGNNDAEKMAAAFIETLEIAGQKVESASFTHGGADNLKKQKP